MTRPIIDLLEFIDLKEMTDKDRTNLIENMILDFYGHFYIESPPDEMYFKLSSAWETLFNSNEPIEIFKALDKFWIYTCEYHKLNTIRIPIKEQVTKNTLYKIIKRTFFGDRINEMGVGEFTVKNIQKGFIGENVLRFIIEKVLTENPRPDVLIAFKTQQKIDFIRNTFIELRLKGCQ